MAVTLENLRGMCYDILREEPNNSAYPYSLVDTLINGAQQAVCSGLVINPLNKEEVRKGQLPFLNREVFYETYLTQYVAEDADAGATEVVMNTQTRPDAGVCYIGGKIIEYREKDENHLLQCTGINGKIKAGEQATIIYQIPSNFMNPINLVLDDRVQIDNEGYDDVFVKIRDIKGKIDYNKVQWRGYDKPFYAIKDDKYLLVYNINKGGNELRLRYEILPTPLLTEESECVIPNDVYAMNVIPYLAVGETMYNRGEEQRGAEVINWGMTKLKEMYKFYNKTGIERYSGQHYGLGKYKFNI